MELFLTAFVGLFVLVDPFGTTAVFMSLSKGIPSDQSKKICVKAFIIALTLLIGFSFLGNHLLSYMGVSLAALKVAGGLLLFTTAFRMITGFHDPDQLEHEGGLYKDRSDIAAFPLAIPLLAGPGVLTGGLMFIGQAHDLISYGYVILAMVLVQLIALLCLFYSKALNKILGRTGESIIGRIMGVLMAAMAVQFFAEGSFELYQQAAGL